MPSSSTDKAQPDGWWWVSSKRMTVGVRTKAYRIVEAPPVVRVFLGQPIGNLVDWMAKQGGLRVEFSDG